MTEAETTLPDALEHRPGRHALLAQLGRWRVRHPRLMFVAMAISLVLPGLLYVLAAWVLTGSGDGARAPSASLALIAPDPVSRGTLTREINAATSAERERISTLAMVIDPFPYQMPVQGAPIGAGERGAQAYGEIFRLLRASGCADEAGRVDVAHVGDPASLQQAEAALVPLQTGSQGLDLARYFYHMGLIQLCKDDMRLAADAFQSAQQHLDSSAAADSAVGQYRFLSAAGDRLASAKLMRSSGETVVLPDLPEVPSVFGQGLCQTGGASGGCALFLWPARRTALVQLHAFLLDPGADPAGYREALANARDGFGQISLRNYANVVVAHAKAGDFEAIGSLLNQLARFEGQKDCDALGRMANVGWIAGQLAEDAESFACSPDLPTVEGAGTDLPRIRVWTMVHGDRNALRVGNFQALIARMNATNKEAPDTRAFLEAVRSELLGRLSTRLLARADALRKQGAGADSPREALLKLLRSKPFPFSTRMQAAIALEWGGLWPSAYVPIGLTLLLFLLLRYVWNMLAGYGLMFTRRHHLEKQAA